MKCSAEDAFRYFTADFQKWWPAHTHSVIAMSSDGARRPASCTLDPRIGGLIIEHGENDERYVWGTVVVLGSAAQGGVHLASRQRGASRTNGRSDIRGRRWHEVVLTHGGWERLAEQAAAAREGYNNGWEGVFRGAYREYVEAQRRAYLSCSVSLSLPTNVRSSGRLSSRFADGDSPLCAGACALVAREQHATSITSTRPDAHGIERVFQHERPC